MNTIFINFYEVELDDNLEIINKKLTNSFDISNMRYNFRILENISLTEISIENVILNNTNQNEQNEQEPSEVMNMYFVAKDKIKQGKNFIIEYNLNEVFSITSEKIQDITYAINPNVNSNNNGLLEYIIFKFAKEE